MPIYEYLCQSCYHRFEVKQKFSDPSITSCGQCGQEVRKLISAPGIVFKGSGWYVTDYSDKLKAPGQSTGKKEGTETKAEKKDGASTESQAKPSEASSGTLDSSSNSQASTPSTSTTSSPSTSSSS